MDHWASVHRVKVIKGKLYKPTNLSLLSSKNTVFRHDRIFFRQNVSRKKFLSSQNMGACKKLAGSDGSFSRSHFLGGMFANT